ncbi:hypothetical protein F8M41_009690 [Gigaspora margarita]|uniref:Malate dehydrogenase n=1 Tax=Gigaspora margarita TaxID=4874 RepID=A0A8H4AV27_GIGMA|nr:hypothetical protein F8M41_009690 [Gigaspora margarita]
MKNFIFAFILFALLLTVNAAPFKFNKRTTTFSACPNFPNAEPLNVSITPDPPKSGTDEKFGVSGALTKHDIVKNKTILGIAYADLQQKPIGDPYHSAFNESYKAGKEFSVSADFSAPQLPVSYFIAVAVGDPTGDPKNPLDVYGCAYALIV